MDKEKNNFKESVRVKQNNVIVTSNDIQKGFDMQASPIVILIDDDNSLINDLKRQLPSVIYDIVDIDTIIRYISKRIEDPVLEQADIIFIDTFYRDEQSGSYALDFFDMYRNISNKTMSDTRGKYKVLISVDEMNERLRNSTSQDTNVVNERTRLASLLGKVHRHPYIEWGTGKGSKTDKIVEEIEKYAEKNKIYLYKNPEMSLNEWIEYINSLINKVKSLVSDIETQKVSDSGNERLNCIISELQNEIDRVSKILGLDEQNGDTSIKSIRDALECTKSLYSNVSKQTSEIMRLGIDEKNRSICNISHHFTNNILSVEHTIHKTERRLAKGIEKND